MTAFHSELTSAIMDDFYAWLVTRADQTDTELLMMLMGTALPDLFKEYLDERRARLRGR